MMNLDVTAGVTLPRLTSPPRLRAWLATSGIAALVLATLASAVTATGALVADDASATPKVYHALLAVAGVVTVFRGTLPRPRVELMLYFGVMIAVTLLTYLAYEPRVGAIKLLIALYVALVSAAIGRLTTATVVLRACRVAAVAFLLIVTAKNALHAPALVLYFANPSGHPDVPTLAGGGLNLEATWVALSSVFLMGTVLFVPFALVAAATSALYASRAGIVVVALAVLTAGIHAWNARRATRTQSNAVSRSRHGHAMLTFAIAAVAVAVFTAAFMAARKIGDTTYVAQRFAAIGDEPGSLGRLTLWRGGLAVFAENPLGVGMGNAVPALRRTLGVDVPEDNLHNIYLQHLVEAGMPGLVSLLVFAVMIARRVFRSRFQDHLLLFAAGYLVVGAIQFTGVDAMLWLVYGLQLGSTNGRVDV
jgi:O-antigen ligase